MAQVSVTINGRPYQVACDDGQEDHLRSLADYVDRRIGQLVAAVGQVGDAHLLVMASLVIADELADASQALKNLPNQAAGNREDREDAALADDLTLLAERMESIAERLERP